VTTLGTKPVVFAPGGQRVVPTAIQTLLELVGRSQGRLAALMIVDTQLKIGFKRTAAAAIDQS